jgi:tetratricopeptide (TPR) repeat protein
MVGERRSDLRTQALRWVEEKAPTGTFIVTEYLGPEFLGTHELWALEPSLRNRVAERSTRPIYAVQRIPMYQVAPERAEGYYDLALYEMADLIVINGRVSSRYLRDPLRYPRQVAFYDSLRTGYERVAEFRRPDAEYAAVTIYKSPGLRPPFAGRQKVPDPRRLRSLRVLSGEESVFYYNLGLNYEAFGFLEQARAAYGIAIEFPLKTGMVYNLATSTARCLLRLGRDEEAIRLLEQAESAAGQQGDRDRLRRLRLRIEGDRGSGGAP